jgi:ubiquinone/menaquinone biosynthesis C-methylase UbiE
VAEQERWQMGGSEAEAYEQYKVPRLFGPLARLLLDRVPLRVGSRVLDVACGSGIVARLAAQRVAPSGKVVGVDLNEEMLAVARAHACVNGTPIEWKQGDATALPFAPDTFDVVLCQQGLQYLPDKPRALLEMHRVLVPGGTLALNVWGKASRYNVVLADALARHCNGDVAKRSLAPFALSDATTVRALVVNAGFSEVELRTDTVLRRIYPTQEWLIQDSGPYAGDVAGMESGARATMIREIAANLREFWKEDCFAVPSDVHFVYARKQTISEKEVVI